MRIKMENSAVDDDDVWSVQDRPVAEERRGFGLAYEGEGRSPALVAFGTIVARSALIPLGS
jgi:hypothetical protein